METDNVIKEIITHVVGEIEGVDKVEKVFTEKYIDGMRIEMDLKIVFGKSIPEVSKNVQKATAQTIENMTGINLFGIDINIVGISRIS